MVRSMGDRTTRIARVSRPILFIAVISSLCLHFLTPVEIPFYGGVPNRTFRPFVKESGINLNNSLMSDKEIVSTEEEPIIPLESEIEKIIRQHALMASATGLIPFAGLDVAVVTAVQTRLVGELARAYRIAFDRHQVRIVLYALMTGVFSRAVALGAHRLFNSFSHFGKWADPLTNAAAAGFFTVAAGEIYRRHFEAGGTLDDFDLNHFVDYLQHLIETGQLHPGTFSTLSSGFRHLTA